jgi:hypothetical protein
VALAIGVTLCLSGWGCGSEVQPVYDILILTPPGTDPFATATTVSLSVGGGQVASRPVMPGQPIDLGLEGLPVSAGTIDRIAVTATDAAGTVVAYGETPPLERLLVSVPLRIFVQPPGSLVGARTAVFDDAETPVGLFEHIAITPPAVGAGSTNVVPAPLFGSGRTQSSVATGRVETSTGLLFTYNPFGHQVDPILSTLVRWNLSAIVRADGGIILFGGQTAPDVFTSSAELFRLDRSSLLFFNLDPVGTFIPANPGLVRARAPLVDLGLIYAIGGENTAGPLDTVVQIDGDATNADVGVTFAPLRLAAPRVGHTATARTFTRDGRLLTEALIFGGAAPLGPVAELLASGSPPSLIPLPGDPGPPRKDHAAVVLPDGRVLIVGGVDDTGQPLASAVLYEPVARSFSVMPLLQTPRLAPAVFVSGGDLVIAGGVGTDAQDVASAERFDAATLLSLGLPIPALGRAGALATPSPEGTTVVVGGRIPLRDEMGELQRNEMGELQWVFSNAVEVYRPRLPGR